MMVLNCKNKTIEDNCFNNLEEFLNEGDTIILNDSKVIPARLIGIKEETKAVIEILLLKEVKENTWEALVKPAKRIHVGTIVKVTDELTLECLEVGEEGIRTFRTIYDGIFLELLERLGHMPLPPYIKEELQDNSRYQTVYASVLGSAAAPTAGLHFTLEYLEKLKNKGINISYVTLHVGLGTFRPVEVEDVTKHHMHSEYYELSKETVDVIKRTKSQNKKVLVVGTTTLRVLESVATKYGNLVPDKGTTDIFIYPGYKFKTVDNLLTNFHLPKSTLIMLVSALAGKEYILKAYEKAKSLNYRFFSFGDCMLILKGNDNV